MSAMTMTIFKLLLAFMMVLLGSITLAVSSSVDNSIDEDATEDRFVQSGGSEDAFDALSAVGWWNIKFRGDLGSYDGNGGTQHEVVMSIGLNGWAMSVQQDFEASGETYDETYFASADWIDEDASWTEGLDDYCEDPEEDLEGWDDWDDSLQQGFKAACACRTSGGFLKAFAILFIFFLTVMSVLDILHLVLLGCGADCISCLAGCFYCIQLVLTFISATCAFVGLGLAAFGCPVYDGDAASGFMVFGASTAEATIEDPEDVEFSPSGGLYMYIGIFLLHMVYLVLTCMMPRQLTKADAPAPPPSTGAGMQMQPQMQMQPAVVGQAVAPTQFGQKFDTETGAPIPKFNPSTGQQNW